MLSCCQGDGFISNLSQFNRVSKMKALVTVKVAGAFVMESNILAGIWTNKAEAVILFHC